MKWRYLLAWLAAIPIGILNGALREFGYRQFLGELPAHQLSTASFVLLFGIYVWIIFQWLQIFTSQAALRIGFTWLILTIAFEFLFGHFVMDHPWEVLLHDYNLTAGRLWVLVLLWVMLAPFIIYRLRKSKGSSAA